jgi:aspartyl-tRNA(Asn)/glutamyl-tRNA(Gln) amidotransferase subunit A
MNYESLTVREFLLNSIEGSLNLEDFYDAYLRKLREANEKFGLFITLAGDAKDQAKSSKGRLRGLPVPVKDNICTKGLQTTAGSRILEGYVPPFDATVVARLRAEGAVIAGKTAMDEFGFGSFSQYCAYGVPKNPLDPARACGGSSGGSAGIIAALDFPQIAIGQSTGGSISAPASYCGVVGLTPTYGRVSRYGLIDFGNSLDKIGPITKTVEDAALTLSLIAGHDPMDQTTVDKGPEDYTKYLKSSVKGLKIGIPKEYFAEGVDEKVQAKVWDAIKLLESYGASYHEISLSSTDKGIAAYYLMGAPEASTNLAKFCGMRYGATESMEGSMNDFFSKVRGHHFGPEAKRRILLGTYARMAGYRDQYYLKALKVRTVMIEEFRKAFRKYDVLMTPTMATIAPRFSEIAKMTPLQNYMADVLTVVPNVAGIPMVSVPCGQVSGMPVGLHILGDYLQEGKVLHVGYAFEKLREDA